MSKEDRERFRYPCPVCNYMFDQWSKPETLISDSFDICPCCGVEFGVDDRKLSHKELGWQWIENGSAWFDDIIKPPADWSPIKQYNAIYLSERDFALFIAALEKDFEPSPRLRAAAARFKARHVDAKGGDAK